MKGRFGVRLRVEDIVGLTRTGCAGVENTYRYLFNIGCKCQIEEGNVLMEGGRVAILMVLSEINNIVSPGICQGLRTGEEIKPESRFQEAAQTDHILSRGKLGVVALIASSFQYLLLDTIHSNGLGGGHTANN